LGAPRPGLVGLVGNPPLGKGIGSDNCKGRPGKGYRKRQAQRQGAGARI
jgi:hypothetical protein